LATKKVSTLETDLKDLDIMTVLSGGGTSKVFEKNTLVDYCYPTGISVIDYYLGYIVNVRDESGQIIKQRECIGLQAGSFNVLTGATQSFKTTLGMQMGSNIAYQFNGNVVHIDAENRLSLQRVKTLTKLPEDWFDADYPRYAIKNGAIGYDTLQEYITEIYENKMKYKDVLTKDTGEVDDHNRPIMLMPPTVVFLDSLSDVIAKEYDIRDKKEWDKQKEMRSNTDGMQNAKTLKGVINDILPMLKEANIIFITIAHENANVAMTAFAGPKKQFQYGNKDIKISGGRTVEYNASALMTFTGEIKDDSRYHVDTDGFEGNTVLFEPTKVSTNESGNAKTGLSARIIIDKRLNGADNLRTLVKFLEDKGRIKGDRRGYKVLNDKGEEISEKFSWKNIYDDFLNDKETYKTFMLTAKEELTKLLAKAHDVAGQIDPFNVNNILNNLNATNGCVVAENGVTFVSRLHINMDEFDYDIAV
jgi:hypothetical protein